MNIETVERQGEGFLINGVTYIDNPEHRFYKAVLEWEKSGGVVEPEFTQTELDEQQRVNLIAELESSITPRNLRGAALGDSFAIAKIQQVESDIAALRA